MNESQQIIIAANRINFETSKIYLFIFSKTVTVNIEREREKAYFTIIKIGQMSC